MTDKKERVVKVDISASDIDMDKIRKVAPKVVNLMQDENISPLEGQVLFAGLIESVQKYMDIPCDCENCKAERQNMN